MGPNRPTAVPDGYLITPFGYFHPSCVRRLAEGEILLAHGSVIQHADGTLNNISACKYPHFTARGELIGVGAGGIDPSIAHSWIVSASTTTSTSYGEISAQWIVPPGPNSNDNQTIYFFPGMEDVNKQLSIIQPVMGWNADFSGSWGIASWNCCISGVAHESSPVPVAPFDGILGTVKSTCAAGTQSCPTWNITTTDQSTLRSTTLSNSPSDGQTFNWAFGGALEVFNVVQCSDYPPTYSLNFSGIALYDDNFQQISSPSWSVIDWAGGLTPQCNYGGQVQATQVTMDYGTVVNQTASASPGQLDFFIPPCGGPPPPQTSTLTNNGPGSLSFGFIGIEGTGSGSFGMSSTRKVGTPLGANNSCTITISYSGSTKKAVATVYLYDTATDNPQTVLLVGNTLSCGPP